MPEPKSPYKRVRRAFDEQTLKTVCEMHEDDFHAAYDMDKYMIESRGTEDNYFYYKDNGSDILAVAHLDTVMSHERRTANFMTTAAGRVVYSGALDDRLGAYTILELLPAMGLKYDILLTIGEEKGKSTAAFFDPDKEYNWMIEFDRGGVDCVMYQYEDDDLKDRVRASGARPASGIFSDISYLDHLEIKGVNWGVGYRDYHGPRSHAFLEDYWMMIGHYLNFHDANATEYLPHDNTPAPYASLFGGSGSHGKYTRTWSADDYSEPWGGSGRSIDDLTDEEIMADLDDLIDLDAVDLSDVDLDDLVSEDYDTVRAAMIEMARKPKELLAPPPPPPPLEIG